MLLCIYLLNNSYHPIVMPSCIELAVVDLSGTHMGVG